MRANITDEVEGMEREEALFYRDQLRQARANALRDAEAFDGIIYVIERLGCRLLGSQGSLYQYAEVIIGQAGCSPLAKDVPNRRREAHTPFGELYHIVRKARNDAMHQGAFARHLTSHAVELSLVLEHSLMNGSDRVSDFMVRSPECAALWQPLSLIRQTMLKSSFSYLPVLVPIADEQSTWKLISDLNLARYLRQANGAGIGDRFVQTLKEAIDPDITPTPLKLCCPHVCGKDAKIAEALKECNGVPILVLSDDPNFLLGILTPFDLL